MKDYRIQSKEFRRTKIRRASLLTSDLFALPSDLDSAHRSSADRNMAAARRDSEQKLPQRSAAILLVRGAFLLGENAIEDPVDELGRLTGAESFGQFDRLVDNRVLRRRRRIN